MAKAGGSRAVIAFLGVVLASSAAIANSAHADEKIEKPAYWLSRGYKPVSHASVESLSRETPSWGEHSLPWPVEFEDAPHSMGNSMLEFQAYAGDTPYYHGGCDLRVAAEAEVHTPVAGRIEAGHYGYSNLPNGSMTKYWYPWPQTGDEVYFEISVVTDDGYRFEFHHMNESRISAEVFKILKDGKGGKVPAGALLGNTIAWPDGVYNHTHYNILTPTGVQLNPEFYSPLLADHQKPQVSAVLASFKNGKIQDFGNGKFSQTPDFFAVAVTDRLDDGVYDHPPVFASVAFEDGKAFAWDFRERLLGPDGTFPSLWTVFVDTIQSPGGERYRTEGGYGEGVEVIRLPVPTGAGGKFKLQVADQAGNTTELEGLIAQ